MSERKRIRPEAEQPNTWHFFIEYDSSDPDKINPGFNIEDDSGTYYGSFDLSHYNSFKLRSRLRPTFPPHISAVLWAVDSLHQAAWLISQTDYAYDLTRFVRRGEEVVLAVVNREFEMSSDYLHLKCRVVTDPVLDEKGSIQKITIEATATLINFSK